MPAMKTVDQPDPDALPEFSKDLADTLERALDETSPHSGEDPARLLSPFTWQAVFGRIETSWLRLTS